MNQGRDVQMRNTKKSIIATMALLAVMTLSMLIVQNALAGATPKVAEVGTRPGYDNIMPSSLSMDQVASMMADQGLSLKESIVGRDGTPQGWSVDDIVGSFGNTKSDYQKVWEPWITRAATHTIALSDDGEFLAVGTGYLSDNEIHIYRWNPEQDKYVLVSQAGDGIIRGDVVDIGFADIDNNGFIDIAAASTDGYVYLFEQAHVYDPLGSTENRFDLVWKSPRMLKAAGVAVYDADLDGITDIITGGWDGKIRVFEYRERSPYPFSEEHTKYLKEVFVSDDLGSPVQQIRAGDFDGDYLPEFIVGLRDGTILIYENAGETISTPNGPFPITYDNFYKQVWNDTKTIWRPILDIQVDDIDNDGMTEAAIVAFGQDVYLLDNDGVPNEYVFDKITKLPQSWERSGAYPIDYYMDILMNGSNIFFNGNLSASEPMGWKDGGNKVSPYTSGMANRSDNYYSLLRASAGKVWALMDWGSYEELVPGGNNEADILIHLNTPWLGSVSDINMTLSTNLENWVYLDSSNIWLSNDRKTIYMDVDPVSSEMKWQFVRYMNMTLSGSVDMEIVYWEAVRINMRMGDTRSVMFSTIIQSAGTTSKVLTATTADGKLISFEYVPLSERNPWEPRMRMILNSYEDQLFTIDTGGAWQMVPNPKHRMVPNWRGPQTLFSYPTVTSMTGLTTVQQVTLGPSLHPYFYAIGDDTPNDIYFVGENNSVAFIPDPYLNDFTEIQTLNPIIFDQINTRYSGFTKIRIAVMDLLYMPWESSRPMPEILVSYYYSPNASSIVGDEFGNSYSGLELYVMKDWQGNASKIAYSFADLGFVDASGNPVIDVSGALESAAKGLPEPLEMGTGDFDGDGLTDLVVSDGKQLQLFKQTRTSREQNGTLTLVPNFFDEINELLETDNKKLENLQGIDYDNDGDADLLASLKGRFGFTFYENIGNSFDPIWREKRPFVHNREPISAFTNYNYELGIIWWNPDDLGSTPSYEFFALNDTAEIGIFEPDYSGQQAWALATYPEVKVIVTNFGNSASNKNWGFEYYEAWSNTLLTQNWTQAMDVGILDGDQNKEIVIADYDNNLYVFEHMTNNTYKRAYRSPDLIRIEQTDITPYASNVLIGIDAPINRSIYENARELIAGVDLDNDGLLEIILATERQIYRFEATGYNDEYTPAGKIILPNSDTIATLNSKRAGIDLDQGITAIATINDMDGNGLGEIVVGFGMYLMMFELTPSGGFKEIMGYDIKGVYNGQLSPYYPTVVGAGNPIAMPFGEITAILAEDLNGDGFIDLIVGGKTNLEVGGYPGFLRIISMGEDQYGIPSYTWREIWNEKYISGFMERNYVTSLVLDDQNYDGKLDLIVGHKYGFDILDVSNMFVGSNRETTISGSPGYPIESYSPVLGYPRNNGSSLNMYSSSITKDDTGYYYVAYSEILTSKIDPINADSRNHIFLSRSAEPGNTKSWQQPFYITFPTKGLPAYDGQAEIMPSLTYQAGFWVLTWVALTYSGGAIASTDIWVAWTDNFYNWSRFYPYLVASWNSGQYPDSRFLTTPQVIPKTGSTIAEFTLAFVLKNSVGVYLTAFSILSDGTFVLAPGGSNGLTVLYPLIANTTLSNFKIHSIAMTQAEASNPGWVDIAVSMAYDQGDGAANLDIWHARTIPGQYYNPALVSIGGNWTRVTTSYQDETYPAIARIGSDSQGLIISYLEKSRSVTNYDIKSVTGVSSGEGWPYQWSEPSDIPTLPYEFHVMRLFEREYSKTVFDGRLFNEVFSPYFEFDQAEYNLFESPKISIGRPALAPYLDGYAMAYAFNFRDPFTPFYVFTFNVGDSKFRIPIYNYIGELFVINNPTDSFLYTDIGETVDLAVGDTDRDGRREVLAGYGRTAELFELQQWQTAGAGIVRYSSEWLDTSLDQNRSRLDTTAVSIFDANGNGFEEIIVASRAGDIRAFEMSDVSLGKTLGSAISVTDLGSLTGGQWKDITSFQWDDQAGLVAMIGEISGTPEQKIIRIYYNVTENSLGNYEDSFETTQLTPKYVMAFPTNNSGREAIIVSIYYNATHMEIRTHKLSGQTISLIQDTVIQSQPLMTTISGGPRPFEPLFGLIDENAGESLVISSTTSAVIVRNDGSISFFDASLGSELPLGFELGDTDGDGLDEIITTYANNTAVSWLANGTQLNKWALPNDVPGSQWFGIAAADINNDGREDLIAGRMFDGLIVALDVASGDQFWNLTLGNTGYLYFRSIESNGNEMVFIVNGYASSVTYTMTAVTLMGIQRWIYKPTNSFVYVHEVAFDKMSQRFLMIMADVAWGLSGNELLVSIDLGGAVEGISYQTTIGTDADQITPLIGNTAIGISEGTERAVKFGIPTPVTWAPSALSMSRLNEIVYSGAENYEVVVDDVNRDGIDEYVFYSLEDNIIFVADVASDGFVPLFTINASRIDIKYAPFLYEDSTNDVSYLVLANYTHLIFIETETLTVKTVYDVLANHNAYIYEIATSDLQNDGNTEIYVELIGGNPEEPLFTWFGGYTRRLLVFGDNSFTPIQELLFPGGLSLSGFDSNKYYMGFIDPFYSGGFFDITLYSHVRVWEWVTGTGLVSVTNYTRGFYVNFAFAPVLGEASDNTIFLAQNDGELSFDTNVPDGIVEVPYASIPQQYLFSSYGYYFNRTYSYSSFREFRAMVITDAGGTTQTLLFVSIADAPYTLFYGTSGFTLYSVNAFDNVQLLVRGDYVDDKLVLGIGNGLVTLQLDGFPVAPYGYLAQGFVTEAGFWGAGDMDVWYKTLNGEIVLAGLSIQTGNKVFKELIDENVYEYNGDDIVSTMGLNKQDNSYGQAQSASFETDISSTSIGQEGKGSTSRDNSNNARPFTIIGLIPLMLLGNKSSKLKKLSKKG